MPRTVKQIPNPEDHELARAFYRTIKDIIREFVEMKSLTLHQKRHMLRLVLERLTKESDLLIAEGLHKILGRPHADLTDDEWYAENIYNPERVK